MKIFALSTGNLPPGGLDWNEVKQTNTGLSTNGNPWVNFVCNSKYCHEYELFTSFWLRGLYFDLQNDAPYKV